MCLDTTLAEDILRGTFHPQMVFNMYDPIYENIKQPDTPSVIWNI